MEIETVPSKETREQETAMPSPEEQPLLLTVPQAAKLLGMSNAHVNRLVTAKALPSLKVGRLRRISRKALEHWIDEQIEQQGMN
jgi:excisionase family DNA binding protein